jgi:hypothetical protein
MMRWQLDQFGVASDALNTVAGRRYESPDTTPLDRFTRSIPGLSRIFRLTNSGDNDKRRAALAEQDRKDAEKRLATPEAVRKFRRDRYRRARDKRAGYTP